MMTQKSLSAHEDDTNMFLGSGMVIAIATNRYLVLNLKREPFSN